MSACVNIFKFRVDILIFNDTDILNWFYDLHSNFKL